MSLESYVRAMPKSELHVHLEGAIQPATVLELARRNRVTLPADDVEGLRRWFAYTDFSHFIDVFVTVTSCLKTAEDYELIVHEFGREMARQNIRYAEATVSPSTHAWLGVQREVWWDGLTRGRRAAEAEFGVQIRWIFDIVRQVSDPATLMPKADYALEVALDGRSDGVVALGLGGNEVGGSAEPFVTHFERAKSAGLLSVPHAGELAGPESVRQALDSIHADRIQHGVRAAEDSRLLADLAMRGTPLDVCPISNICLGVYPTLDAHPLRALYDAGIAITVNSDDPPLFGTDVTANLLTLATRFGFGVAEIDEIALNAVRHAAMPGDERGRLEAEMRAEMAELRRAHLTDEV